MNDIKRQTLRGMKWSVLGTFLQVSFQIGVIAVLGRLLGPAEYGLLAMASAFTRFAAFFSRMGLGPALIQKKDIDKEDVQASFTLAVALGVVFTIVTILIAPLAAILFKNDEVVSVVRWLALSFVLGGFSLTAVSLLRRQMRFKALAFVETSAFVIGSGVVTIVCAMCGFGVWSLVAGLLTQQTLIVLLAFPLARHSLTPILSRRAYRRCFRVGVHFSVNNFLDWFYAKVEVFLMGNLYSERLLGFYNRGYKLAHMPVQHMVTSISKVIFTAFSRLQGQKEPLSRALLTTFTLVGLAAGSISAGMIAAAREIIIVVLSAKWAPAIPVLQILAFGVPMVYVMSIQGVFLAGTGRLAAYSKLRICGIIMKVLILLYSASFGFHGLLVGIGVSLVFQMTIMSFFVVRFTGLAAIRFISSCLLIFANALFIGGTIWCVTLVGRMVDMPIILLLVAQIVTGAIALFASFSVILRYSLGGLHIEDFASVPIIGRVFCWRAKRLDS